MFIDTDAWKKGIGSATEDSGYEPCGVDEAENTGMGKFNVSVWLVLALAVALTGCSSVKTVDLNVSGRGPSLVTDATERIVTNIDIVNNSIPGQVLPKRIVCAEPSPDVAKAFSEAISAGIKTEKNSAAFSRSFSMSIAQLGERLATVQLLRDMAYRNCEAYANGAISATSYTILNSRLHKTIATLLSSEMMAGAFGRNLAVLTPSSESESSVGGGDANKGDDANQGDNANQEGNPNKGGDANNRDISTKSTSNSGGNSKKSDYAIGQILLRQQTPPEVADQLKQVHRNFIEDISFITLVDACIAHMSAPQKNKIEKYKDIVNLIHEAKGKKAGSFVDKIQKDLTDVDKIRKDSTDDDSSPAGKLQYIIESETVADGKKTEEKRKLSTYGSEIGYSALRFTEICEKSVLGEVKGLTERLSRAKTEIRRLQVINSIVKACNKDDKARDSSVCRTLDISRLPTNNNIE